MARPMNFPINIGVRLSLANCRKLETLCTVTDLAPSELVRLLIETTDPGAVATSRVAEPRKEEVLRTVLDGGSVVK
jgi:hypothetical protein